MKRVGIRTQFYLHTNILLQRTSIRSRTNILAQRLLTPRLGTITLWIMITRMLLQIFRATIITILLVILQLTFLALSLVVFRWIPETVVLMRQHLHITPLLQPQETINTTWMFLITVAPLVGLMLLMRTT